MTAPVTARYFDVKKVRDDFPILHRQVHGKPLVFFDNAATSQKPQQVIDRLVQYYAQENANIHRGVYYLSEIASTAYEGARDAIQLYMNAASRSEIVFVRGATEGINLVAQCWGRKNLNPGDEVVITMMEHHANLVPWQLICQERGAKVVYVPHKPDGTIDAETFRAAFTERTRFASFVHISNSLGTINPAKEMVAIAKSFHVPVLVDGCQAAPHFPLDVQDLGCDFFVFSGHKTFGPTGSGVLYGREEILDTLPPYQSGGDMIKSVSVEGTTFNDLPHRFEAGTPHIEGAIGLQVALQYLANIGHQQVHDHEKRLGRHLHDKLEEIEGLTIIGTAKDKVPTASFVIEGVHPLDLGTMLDFEGVAVRTGNHCTQPLLHSFGVEGTCRASLAFYNTIEEIDYFADALKKVVRMLKA